MAILATNEFGILRLTISRPQKRNAINAEMFDTLTSALTEASADDSVRVVLLQGEEQIFSAGADLEELNSSPENIDRAMTAFFSALREFKKPIVAQVQGPCVGEAFAMLLYCDLIYTSDKALFSLPVIALAKTPRFGAAHIMSAAAGLPKAAEKILLSEPITAQEAEAMRLITAVYDAETLDQAVAAKVARLTVLPPQAVQATKALLTAERNRAIAQAAETEESVYRRQLHSAEAREALNAFLEGRKPVFRPE